MKAGIVIAFLATTALAACATRLRDTTAGAGTYRSFCAPCHGDGGRGDGPAAAGAGAPVPDLTRIAARNGGTFPQLRIYQLVSGLSESEAERERHMRRWGWEFFGSDADDAEAHREAIVKVEQVVAYLESIQAVDGEGGARRPQ